MEWGAEYRILWVDHREKLIILNATEIKMPQTIIIRVSVIHLLNLWLNLKFDRTCDCVACVCVYTRVYTHNSQSPLLVFMFQLFTSLIDILTTF